jgi:hypothetical protein
LVKIPAKAAGLNTETQISVSKEIDGSEGGNITLFNSYISQQGNTVTLSINLDIPKKAFDGVRTITIIADDQYAVLDCNPSMVFNKSLSLDFSYLGIDPSDLNLSNKHIGFFYLDNNGTFQPVSNSGVIVNPLNGQLSVKNAKIDHFSRYGWSTFN